MASSAWQKWFTRPKQRPLRCCRRASIRAVAVGRVEPLEPRVVLAADVFSQRDSGTIDGGWHVIVLDSNADDLYLRNTQIVAGAVVGDGPRVIDVIQFDTDANFGAPAAVDHAPSLFRDVLVTNGVRNQETGGNFFASSNGGATLSLATAAQAGIVPPNAVSSLNAVVPGTLSGFVSIDDARGGDSLFFTTQRLQDGGTTADVLVFSKNGNDWAPAISITHSIQTVDAAGKVTIEDKTISIDGDFDYSGGSVFLDFTAADNFALFNGNRSITADYAAPIIPNGPSTVRLAPGLTLNTGLLIDLPGEDSSIEIASPVLSAGVDNVVVLSATNVAVNAPVTSNVGFYSIGTTGTTGGSNALSGVAGNWYGGGGGDTEVEQLVVQVPITATEIGVVVIDDQDSAVRNRGLLYVASSGALLATTQIAVEASTSDIVFEGDVTAAVQSYLFRTETDPQPFRFVTTRSDGASVGSISGTTVDVFLANEQPFDGADSVEHVVSLDTNVASLRISATQSSGQLSGLPPFRYAVSIREQDALALDASLASAGPISIRAGGALAVNASVLSTGDVSLASGAAITGNAWLSTTEGSVSVTGSAVSLDGLVQVLAPPVDETLTDVEIVATNGSISLGGGVSAVNRIHLDQRGSGSVSSNGLVAAEYLDVFSTGGVTLQTQSRFINVESGGQVAIEEADDAEFVVTAAGLTSLLALGIDPNDGSGRSALKAELRGATNIMVSAPAGSVDVTAMTSAVTTVGDAARLLTGTAASMQAAGDVFIRSTQGDIVLLDAPIAGDGLLQARVASASNGLGGSLSGTYAQNNPGVTPATLTGLGNRSLNSEPTFAAVFPGLGGSPLRVRDLVLLRGQSNANENGLYQISQLGSTTTPWRLTRVSGADTTAEFGTNTRVSITDGEFAGGSFRVGSYTNDLNTTPLRVTQGAGRSASELTVRLATDATPLAASFVGGQLTASANGALSLQGLAPASGDFILVSHGVTGDPGASSAANGVYEVTDAGSSVTPWILTRVANVEEATVVVSEGYYRTALTGLTFRVAYDGLGEVPVVIDEAAVTAAIGSYDPRDAATFVVSTAGGTNDDAGSLGKMLRLVQSNSATDLSGERVEQSVRFGNVLGGITGPTGTIVLRQELPVINTVFEIDSAVRHPLSGAAAQPIVVDGSRITSTRESTFVTGATEVNGFEFAAGASTVLTPTPEEANRSRLSGLRIAGFEAGGAVVVNGASNLLVENLTIGLNTAGASQAVRYGVRVTGASGAAGPVTLLDNSIYSASVFNTGAGAPLLGAGVFIDGAAQSVQVVGGTIGGAQGSNTSGIVVESSNDDSARANSIGVNPLSTIKLTTTSNRATLTISPADWDTIGEDLHLGQSVSGNGIAAGSEIIHINPATRAVVLSNRMTSSIVDSTITFGTPGRTTVSDNFYGVELRSGHVRMVNTTIVDSVLDGVVVGTALPAALWARIGAGIALNAEGNPDPTIRSSASNAIHSNGRYGIRFASGIDSMTESFAPANPPTLLTPTQISIRGNYIGTNTSGATGLQNGRSDYYWDNTNSIEPPSASDFESLVTQGDPNGANPAEDNGNGNISADLAPPSSGTALPSTTSSGVVRVPTRR
jgi:hypothetical protein